jgi:hypothetical protein
VSLDNPYRRIPLIAYCPIRTLSHFAHCAAVLRRRELTRSGFYAPNSGVCAASQTSRPRGRSHGRVKSDIEIARAAKKKPIMEIGAGLGIPAEHLLPYGHDKAKISAEFIKQERATRTAS